MKALSKCRRSCSEKDSPKGCLTPTVMMCLVFTNRVTADLSGAVCDVVVFAGNDAARRCLSVCNTVHRTHGLDKNTDSDALVVASPSSLFAELQMHVCFAPQGEFRGSLGDVDEDDDDIALYVANCAEHCVLSHITAAVMHALPLLASFCCSQQLMLQHHTCNYAHVHTGTANRPLWCNLALTGGFSPRMWSSTSAQPCLSSKT